MAKIVFPRVSESNNSFQLDFLKSIKFPYFENVYNLVWPKTNKRTKQTNTWCINEFN